MEDECTKKPAKAAWGWQLIAKIRTKNWIILCKNAWFELKTQDFTEKLKSIFSQSHTEPKKHIINSEMKENSNRRH